MDEREQAERWRIISLGNLRAAKLLYNAEEYRAATTRAYYAAYHAATAECILHGDTDKFPPDWNNPTHDQLPDLMRNNGNLALSIRRRISQELRGLRRAREDADYRPGHTVDASAIRNALHSATMILELLEVI